METQIKIAGSLLIFLSMVHLIFPSYFKWDKELKALSLINRQMMQVHTFFIALAVVLMGILCVTSSNELITTALGKRLALGLGIFWLTRLFIQFFIYSPQNWKGKTFETAVHISFSLFWVYLATIFLTVYFN